MTMAMALVAVAWLQSPQVQKQGLSAYDVVLSFSSCKVMVTGLNREATTGPTQRDGDPVFWLCKRASGRKAQCEIVDANSGNAVATETYDIAFEDSARSMWDAANGATKVMWNGSAVIMSSINILTRDDGASGFAVKSCTGLRLTGDEAQALMKQ